MTKYNSKKVEVDGIVFDSVLESRYYLHLKERLANGEIKNFILQPSYELTPSFEKNGKKVRAITYKPDFLIRHLDDSMEAIDVKGFSTQASEMRKKMFDYRYQNIKLTWVSYVKKWGGWIEVGELKHKRKENNVRNK